MSQEKRIASSDIVGFCIGIILVAVNVFVVTFNETWKTSGTAAIIAGAACLVFGFCVILFLNKKGTQNETLGGLAYILNFAGCSMGIIPIFAAILEM